MMELLFENSLGLKADRNVDTKLNGGWIQLLTPAPPHPTLTFVMESLCENGLHLKAEREVDRNSKYEFLLYPSELESATNMKLSTSINQLKKTKYYRKI